MVSSRKWNDLTKRVENVQRGMSNTNVELKKRKDVKKNTSSNDVKSKRRV